MISKLAPAITALSKILDNFPFLLSNQTFKLFTIHFSLLLLHQTIKLLLWKGELTISEGIEHQFTVEEMDDETYTGLLIYK